MPSSLSPALQVEGDCHLLFIRENFSSHYCYGDFCVVDLKISGNYFHRRDKNRDKEKRIPSLYEQGKLFTWGIENPEAFKVFFTFLNLNEGSKTPQDKRRVCHTLRKLNSIPWCFNKLAVFLFEVAYGCAYATRWKDYHDRVSYWKLGGV